MRLGILQCDSVRPEFLARFGDYPAMFRRLLQPLAPRLEFVDYDVRHGRYPHSVEDCDGYLITGSRAGVYDPEPWIAELADYLRLLRQGRKRVVGVCFGHQLIAHALGGRTQRSERGWGVGAASVRVGAARPWMDPPLEEFELLYSHQDQVLELPPGAQLLAGNEFCPVAAFELDGKLLGIQGHPEFEPAYSRAVMALRAEQIGAERLARGLASLQRATQHREIGRWMLNFLGAGPPP